MKKPVRLWGQKDKKNNRLDLGHIVIGIFLLQALILFPLQVKSHKSLYADGAHFFMGILKNQDVLRFDWPRQFAQDISQFPLVAAIRLLKIRSIEILSFFFGATLHLIPFVGILVAALLMFREGEEIFLILLLVAGLYLSINTSFHIISESQVATAVFWIILSLLITINDDFPNGKKAALLLFSFLSIRLYESFVLLGLILALTGILQFLKIRRQLGHLDQTIFFTCLFLFFSSSIISAISILQPRDKQNLAGLILSLKKLDFMANSGFLASSFVFGLFLGGLLAAAFAPSGRRLKQITQFSSLAMILAGGSLLAGLTFFGKLIFSPETHYQMRFLNMVVPAGVGLIILIFHRTAGGKNQIGLRRFALKTGSLAFILFLVWNIFFQIFACHRWLDYDRLLIRELDSKQGMIDLTDTSLAGEKFNCSYALPSLSLALNGIHRQGIVKSLVIDTRALPFFNLSDVRSFPDYTEYGIRYEEKAFEVHTPDLFVTGAKHAAGDFDGDGVEEAAVDLDSDGVWLWKQGSWTCLSMNDANGLLPRPGDPRDGVVTNFRIGGLWLWQSTWIHLSSKSARCLATIRRPAHGETDDVIASFDASGVWWWNGKDWKPLTQIPAEMISSADLDGNRVEEIVGDFGEKGLWIWESGHWTQLSPLNADSLITGDLDGDGDFEIVVDFHSFGLWIWEDGHWSSVSDADPNLVCLAHLHSKNYQEIVVSYDSRGLWLWKQETWMSLRDVQSDLFCPADIDGDGLDELIVDLDHLGLWIYDGGTWNRIHPQKAKSIFAFDGHGNGCEQVWVDFGESGNWIWDQGIWLQVTSRPSRS